MLVKLPWMRYEHLESLLSDAQEVTHLTCYEWDHSSVVSPPLKG